MGAEEIDLTPEDDAILDAIWDSMGPPDEDDPAEKADLMADILGGLGARPEHLDGQAAFAGDDGTVVIETEFTPDA